MEIKYKPTKTKKEKPFKAPKAEKAAKPMNFGSAHSVKIDKSQKTGPAKTPKTPKPEKAVSFTPTKVEKATEFKAFGKLPKSVNPKVLAIVLPVIALVAIFLVAFPAARDFLNEEPPVVTAQKLTITTLPEKTTYYVGESLSYHGMELTVTLSSGTVLDLDITDCQITGFDSSVPANQTITVKYKDLKATFDVLVMPSEETPSTPTAPAGTPDGLSVVTLPKTEYKVGEYLNVSGGMLLYKYGDTVKDIELTYSHIANTFDNQTPGEYKIIVKYYDPDHDNLVETTYTITVTE